MEREEHREGQPALAVAKLASVALGLLFAGGWLFRRLKHGFADEI